MLALSSPRHERRTNQNLVDQGGFTTGDSASHGEQSEPGIQRGKAATKSDNGAALKSKITNPKRSFRDGAPVIQ
jgi:hypothetical protein